MLESRTAIEAAAGVGMWAGVGVEMGVGVEAGVKAAALLTVCDWQFLSCVIRLATWHMPHGICHGQLAQLQLLLQATWLIRWAVHTHTDTHTHCQATISALNIFTWHCAAIKSNQQQQVKQRQDARDRVRGTVSVARAVNSLAITIMPPLPFLQQFPSQKKWNNFAARQQKGNERKAKAKAKA